MVGADVLVGPLAKVLQGLKIGERAMIGMGCTVLRAVPDDAAVWPRPDNPLLHRIAVEPFRVHQG